MNTILQDLSYGLRMLWKDLSFTFVAVTVLALGIASSTAIFSVVDQVLLHPLAYPDADSLLVVSQTTRSTGTWNYDASPANYLDWASQNHVFSLIAASSGMQANLAGEDKPERIRITMATATFFPLFGVNPILGRTFGADDAKPGNAQVAVLSYDLWQRRYGSDRAIVGRDLLLDGEKRTVIGVMPKGFSPDRYGELWIPSPFDVPMHPLSLGKDPREFRDRSYLDVWARMKSGVTLQQARAEMDRISRVLEKQYPDANKDVGIGLSPLHEETISKIRPVLLVLSAAVLFVLLIGCANIANLLMARAAARSKEISIRAALGATRGRLVRQLLTESVLLAVIGGALGVILAAWGIPLLLSLSPAEIGGFLQVGLNREVLGFTLLASIATGLMFGIAPALYASQSNPNESLRVNERGSTFSRSRGRAVLVSAEVALSLMLLVGAGLMVRSFAKLTRVDAGFNPDRLLVFNLGLPTSVDSSRQAAFFTQVVDRIRQLPEVKEVGAVSRLPLAGGNSSRSFRVLGSDQDYNADIRISTPDYFRTMEIPLLRGREFNAHDRVGSVPVAMLNEEAARKVFPGQDPIGKYVVKFGPSEATVQIIGVVGNVRHVTLERAPRPEIYLPVSQAQWPSMFVAVRTLAQNPLTMLNTVQNAVWSVDKNIPLANVRTMGDVIAQSVGRQKFTMLLLTIFAGVAMVLASIGLYGVISYSVSQLTREIGIRIALGARRDQVSKLIVGEGMTLVGWGLAIGIVGSVALTRLISSLLFGVSATDITTFVVVSVILILVAFLASWLPARRASVVDPIVALRTE